MSAPSTAPSSLQRNIPLFITFRLLFNARFYYPVFAVIQLDYGLSMTQFAILNAVWAVTIIILEVPSGALADLIGRKRMVVLAAGLMVAEIALIAFVPFGNPSLIFWVWVLNRILSGAAEAAASGADEALAYDSLPEKNREALWPKVLTKLTTFSSIAFIIAMLLGAFSYDVDLLNSTLQSIGSTLHLEKETVIRFPFLLTLGTACTAVIIALLLKEPTTHSSLKEEQPNLWKNIGTAYRTILGSPLLLTLILTALIHDTLLRLFLTTNSEYYRLILIPERYFGIIGATFALLGILAPQISERLVARNSIRGNYLIVSLLTLLGLSLMALALPYYGVAVILFLAFAFRFLNYFTSHYLNTNTPSAHRATILSFKGLALNIGFGTLSLAYAGLLSQLHHHSAETTLAHSPLTSDPAFPASLPYFPLTFLVLLTPLLIFQKFQNSKKSTPST